MASRVAAGVAAVLVAATLSGCGGRSDDEAFSCRSRLIDPAAFNVVARAFENGKLGSRAQVQAELGRTYAPASPRRAQLRYGSRYFDDEGHLIPYSKLTQRQRPAMNDFIYVNGRVHAVVREDQQRAIDAAARRADDSCS
jgi:hypothetical protein